MTSQHIQTVQNRFPDAKVESWGHELGEIRYMVSVGYGFTAYRGPTAKSINDAWELSAQEIEAGQV